MRTAMVTRERLRSQVTAEVTRGQLRSQITAKVTRGRLRSQKSCYGPMRIAKVTGGRLIWSKNDTFIIALFRAEIKKISVRSRSRSRQEPPFFVWSQSRFFCLEPESATGPRTSGAGAAQKSGGSATLTRMPVSIWKCPIFCPIIYKSALEDTLK